MRKKKAVLLKNFLIPPKPQADSTITEEAASFNKRFTKKGRAGRKIAREVTAPAAAAKIRRFNRILRWRRQDAPTVKK